MRLLFSLFFFILFSYYSIAQINYNGNFEQLDYSGLPAKWCGSFLTGKYLSVDSLSNLQGKKTLRIYCSPDCNPYASVTITQSIKNISNDSNVRVVYHFKLAGGAVDTNNIFPFINPNMCSEPEEIKKNFMQSSHVWKQFQNNWYQLEAQTIRTLGIPCQEMLIGFVIQKGTQKHIANELNILIDSIAVYVNDQLLKNIPPIEQHWYNEEMNNLQNNIIQLNTIDDFSNFNDFAFLKSKLKNAEIVGLGESVYGSHEIFSLRNKLIFYLIDSLNFGIVTFANDDIPAKKIDRFISPEDFNQLKIEDSSYYNIRGSNEMMALSRELDSRIRNKKFIQTEEYNLQNYYYLRNVLLAAFSEYDSSLLLQLKKIEQYRYSEPYNDNKYHTLNSMVQEMADSFSAKKSLHIKMGVANTEQIRGCLSSFSSIYKLQQTEATKLNDKNYERRQFYRDSLIANNIISLRNKYPGKKIIVIGNSGHVGKETCSLEYTPSSMGEILKKILGKKYINFDLLIGEGTISGYNKYREPAIYHLPKAGLFNYGYYFSKIPTSCYYLDVQQIHENRILTDLQTSLIGFDYTPKPQFYSTDLNKSFDGVFFIHTSTPSKSLYMNP